MMNIHQLGVFPHTVEMKNIWRKDRSYWTAGASATVVHNEEYKLAKLSAVDRWGVLYIWSFLFFLSPNGKLSLIHTSNTVNEIN